MIHPFHPGCLSTLSLLSIQGSLKNKGGMPLTGPGTPRDKPSCLCIKGFSKLFFCRICEADPLTAFGLVSSTESAKQIL